MIILLNLYVFGSLSCNALLSVINIKMKGDLLIKKIEESGYDINYKQKSKILSEFELSELTPRMVIFGPIILLKQNIGYLLDKYDLLEDLDISKKKLKKLENRGYIAINEERRQWVIDRDSALEKLEKEEAEILNNSLEKLEAKYDNLDRKKSKKNKKNKDKLKEKEETGILNNSLEKLEEKYDNLDRKKSKKNRKNKKNKDKLKEEELYIKMSRLQELIDRREGKKKEDIKSLGLENTDGRRKL